MMKTKEQKNSIKDLYQSEMRAMKTDKEKFRDNIIELIVKLYEDYIKSPNIEFEEVLRIAEFTLELTQKIKEQK